MNPKPLAGMFTNHLLENAMELSSINYRVVRYIKWRMKLKNVSLFLFMPNREARNHRRACSCGDLGKSYVRAGGRSEEVDKSAFFERCVLIDQDPDGFVLVQRAKNRPRGVPLDDQVIARELAALFDQAIDARGYRAAGS